MRVTYFSNIYRNVFTSTCSYVGYTVNSPNNGHFGARPTVRYPVYVLYWGIIVVATFNVKYDETLEPIT